MTDPTVNLEEIKSRVWKFAEERDWPQFHSPKNLSMALAAESGELMEHFLWCSPEESRTAFADPARARKIREELADIVIYAIQFANVTQTDLAAAIADKMARNAAKYPVEKAKGSSRKYDEL